MSLFLFQDMFNLLSTIGQTVFWTQLGFGLFLFVCLMVTTGLILWCRIKRRQLREQLEASDPSQPSPPSLPDRPSQPDRPRQPEQPSLPDRPRPDLNAAWNNADSTSIYDDPRDLAISTNPFVGWDGTFKGRQQDAGMYVYYIRYTNLIGEASVVKGTFTLLR